MSKCINGDKSVFGIELFKLKLQIFFHLLYLFTHLSAPPKPKLASRQQTSSSYPRPLLRPIPSQRSVLSQFRRSSRTSNIENQTKTPISRSPLSLINNTQSMPNIGATKKTPKKIQPRSQENPVE